MMHVFFGGQVPDSESVFQLSKGLLSLEPPLYIVLAMPLSNDEILPNKMHKVVTT